MHACVQGRGSVAERGPDAVSGRCERRAAGVNSYLMGTRAWRGHVSSCGGEGDGWILAVASPWLRPGPRSLIASFDVQAPHVQLYGQARSRTSALLALPLCTVVAL